MNKRKRYGVIIEYRIEGNINEDGGYDYHYFDIMYYSSLERAKNMIHIINGYKKGAFIFRVYGIFDYEKICYKYIVKEDITNE